MVNWGVMVCVFMSIKKGRAKTLDKCNLNHTGVSSPHRDMGSLGLSGRPSQCPSAPVSGTDGSGCMCECVCLLHVFRQSLGQNSWNPSKLHGITFIYSYEFEHFEHGILSAFCGASVGGLPFSALFYRMQTVGSKQYANPVSSDSSILSKAK